MHLKSLLFVLVVLSGSKAALPDVGSCTFMEYYCAARKCSTNFIKGVQRDPNGSCSAKFNVLTSCATKSAQSCAGSVLSKSQIDNIIRESYKENIMCLEGGNAIPTMPSIGSPCAPSFSTDADNCLRTFHEKFAANKADPDLCSENAKAKKCMKNLIASACTLPSTVQEMLDLAFSDYNPFCKDNRDPGAIGNDQCYGYSGSPATAVMNMGVAKALLFYFLFLFFFV